MSLVLVSRPIVKKFGKIRAYFWLEIILLTKYFSLKSSKKKTSFDTICIKFCFGEKKSSREYSSSKSVREWFLQFVAGQVWFQVSTFFA